MKVQTGDCIELLRRFEIAPGDAVPNDISRLKVSHPSPTNTLAEFRHGSSTFVLLFDDDAEDDADYVHEQVQIALPGRNATLLENPSESSKLYSLPHEGKSVYLLQIDAEQQRLDAYLASTRPELSRSSWQKQIKDGRVSVDGEAQTSPKYAVTAKSTVSVELPDRPTHDDRDLPIVYIDDDVIVVDKPVGVLTHTKNQLDIEFTVADFFRRYTTHGLDGDRPGIVHRLDRDTSGLVIGARHDDAYMQLKQQFADREVTKTYLAVVEGHPETERLRIDLPIARDSTRPGSFTVRVDGKTAQTELEVLRRSETRSLLRLGPRTGRTHQLRVHLAHLGLPIIGDRLYGKPGDRLYLHASELTIVLPNGKKQTFHSATPDEFETALEQS